MSEAAGRGEGETEDDGKVTWLVDRPPAPQDFDSLLGGLGVKAAAAAADPLRTLPIRAFEWNHCKLDEIDQDMLEYLYSGAALS